MNVSSEQKFSYEEPVPRIITQPLGDVPSYYRRINSKSELQSANLNAGSTVLGWLEMFHAYSGEPNSKEKLKTMHEYANAVFGDGDEKRLTFELDFEGNPKRMTVRTVDEFDFRECEMVTVDDELRTDCETTIGDMAVILDEISGQLTTFDKNEEDTEPYVTHLALGFKVDKAETTLGVRVEFDEEQTPEDAVVHANSSYCTAMQSLGQAVDIEEE